MRGCRLGTRAAPPLPLCFISSVETLSALSSLYKKHTVRRCFVLCHMAATETDISTTEWRRVALNWNVVQRQRGIFLTAALNFFCHFGPVVWVG